MSYGITTTNRFNEKVLGTEEPLFVKKREGILTNSGFAGTPEYTNNYFYKFYRTGGAVATGNEIVLYDIGTENHIAFPPATDPENLGDIMYQNSTLRYVVMEPRDLLDTPTGYGAACFNSAGECTYSTSELLCSISGGFIERDWDYIGQKSIYGGPNPLQPNLITGSNSSIIIIGQTPSLNGGWILSATFYDGSPNIGIQLITKRFDVFDFSLPFDIRFAQDFNSLYGNG
jgi:hypothetical protein